MLRRFTWRLGRALYLRARSDGRNLIATNGERRAQTELVNWCAKTHRRAMVFDVGANTGQWSMSLIDEARRRGVDTSFEIHAFEPVDETFRVLQARCAELSSRVTIRPLQCALSRADGTAEMHVVGAQAGTNSLHKDAMANDERVISISTRSAVSYCADRGISYVDFLKSDTEGHDYDVVLGAKELFDEQRIGCFQFEYNHRWVYSRHYLKDMFDFVAGRPYVLGKLTPGGIEIFGEWHPELERFFETNYVLLHKDALRIYSHRLVHVDSFNTYA